MPVHDTYARITPYELLLPESGFSDERFPAIQAEAKERGVDLSDPERFALLSEAGAILRVLRGEEDDPRLIHQFGSLLYHAYHFWDKGHPLYQVDTGVIRYLLEGSLDPPAWEPALPAESGYLQLPQHLFWAPGQAEAPPESADGLFWTAVSGDSLALLLTMGLRRDRPGISVVPLPTLPLAAAAEWRSATVRPGGQDFGTSMPGSELENLYGLEAGAEAVKLAMLLFWYLDAFPGSVGEGVSGTEGAEGPRPSRLPYRHVTLGEGGS